MGRAWPSMGAGSSGTRPELQARSRSLRRSKRDPSSQVGRESVHTKTISIMQACQGLLTHLGKAHLPSWRQRLVQFAVLQRRQLQRGSVLPVHIFPALCVGRVTPDHCPGYLKVKELHVREGGPWSPAAQALALHTGLLTSQVELWEAALLLSLQACWTSHVLMPPAPTTWLRSSLRQRGAGPPHGLERISCSCTSGPHSCSVCHPATRGSTTGVAVPATRRMTGDDG